MGLSVDYVQLVRGLRKPLVAADVGAVLLRALAEHYERGCSGCKLLEFVQSGATYLFDFASTACAAQEDRTVAAWTVTPAAVGKRDASYFRHFPMLSNPEGTLIDRGHLIPHQAGGELGPNIFKLDRIVNRGWSHEGKRFRALRREAAVSPGTFYFAHLIYADDSANPTEIEVGVLRGQKLHVERFRNRY